MKKINEIFYSLQGEGHNTGVAAVFVRFSGCNLRCDFCDTNHHDGKMMTDDEIVGEINRYSQAPLVVLTGGEPSLFIDEAFVAKLKHETHKTIAIETNGTNPLPQGIDWVTLSPKNGFAGGDLASVVITQCDELKVVYLGQDLKKYDSIVAKYRYLQPCFVEDEQQCNANKQRCVEAVLKNPEWRLSLQVHRILNIR